MGIGAGASWALSTKDSYFLYFLPNRSDLVGDNRRVIEEAADRIKKSPNIRLVEITGHADRIGPRGYNELLSEHRAIVGRNMLIALGVPPSLIRITWRGEEAPLVPTADEVEEPQNRRTEIRLIFRK